MLPISWRTKEIFGFILFTNHYFNILVGECNFKEKQNNSISQGEKMKLNKKTLHLLAIVLLTYPLQAQTAIRLSAILDKPAISYGEAAAFALEAADKGVFDTAEEAFRFAKDHSWLPKKAQIGNDARYNGIALLLVEAFELKGGMFYRAAKNPHYAYRELVYRDVIQGEVDPKMIVSGEEFLFMINRILDIKETLGLAVVETEQGVEQEGIFIPHILFPANSAVLMESEKIKLREIAALLEKVPERNIIIEGHTALSGTQEERLKTGLERARAVADYLILLGVRTEREISIRGYGAEHPVANNSTAEGMAQNRRAEISIRSKGEGQ